MTRSEKFLKLQDAVLDKMLEGLENGELGAMDLQTCVTFLKNNKMTEEKPPEPTEADLMNEILAEIKNGL